MKFHLTTASGQNLITGYEAGFVSVNHQKFDHSLIVMADKLYEDWPVADFPALTEQHFEFIAGLAPEVVLLGTGQIQHFPHPKLTRSLTDAGIGIEVMNTGAACRTYNILMSEGRKVAAALLID